MTFLIVMKLTFDLKDPRLDALVTHSIAHAKHHGIAFPKQRVAAPSLTLVFDEEIFLMSPHAMAGAPDARLFDGEVLFKVYAEGHGPGCGLISSDDRSDTLPIAEFVRDVIRDGYAKLVLNVTASRITTTAIE